MAADSPDSTTVTRREALRRLGQATLAGAALGACAPKPSEARPPAATSPAKPAPSTRQEAAVTATRMPAVFLPHGGGPWPFVEVGFGRPEAWQGLRTYLESLRMTPPDPPKALLVISAHWEEAVPTVQSAARPSMLYDYYGFPEASYSLEWPAPGHPELAAEVRELLEAAGIPSADDGKRGFDHGTFVVTKVAWPDAAIPTFQLSLKKGLDPAAHLAMGRALAPLRDAGVFLIGSGMSYHNMRGFQRAARGDAAAVAASSQPFDAWLAETVAAEPSVRASRLIAWERAPEARACHPREEHLLPLMVIAGAGLEDAATTPYREVLMGAHVSAAQFG